MKPKKRIQTSPDNEMSFIDIIQLLIFNRRLITRFIILGGILGGLYGQFSKPVYNASILFVPARISGLLIESPQKTISIFQAKYNDFSKEIISGCPLGAIKTINFSNADGSNFSTLKEVNLIKISMQNTDKTIINNCLDQVADEISLNQNKIAQPILDFKKNQIITTEDKLKILIDLGNKIDIKEIKEINTNKTTFDNDILLANIIQNNISEIRLFNEWNYKNKSDSLLNNLAHKASGIEIKIKPFPSFKYGAFFGIMLGFALGILVAIARKMKALISF